MYMQLKYGRHKEQQIFGLLHQAIHVAIILIIIIMETSFYSTFLKPNTADNHQIFRHILLQMYNKSNYKINLVKMLAYINRRK